ncbi:AAA family ATPase [Rhodopseudomonas rhenobacensis]
MQSEVLEARSDEAFESLADLRSAHSALMRDARKESRQAIAGRVASFIRRAQATGTRIESQNDRDSAQGVIDYWAAWQFSADNIESLSAAPPTLAEFVPSEAPQGKPAENPFVGLRAFAEADASLFIGREEATRDILERLQRDPIMFISGPLGCGKTSLVFAGVIPRLRSRGVLETKKEPVFPVVIPGVDPLAALLKAIVQVATAKPSDAEAWIAAQRPKLQRNPAALKEIVATVVHAAAVILVVDQFEEVFTQCEDPAVRDQFAAAVAGLVTDATAPNRAILIIREDYAQRSYALTPLKRFADQADTRFSPPLPTVAELVRTLSATAAAGNLRFDDGIIEDLAHDVAGDPASLPTLQFTLSRLWAALPQDSNRITRDIYRRVGKPRVALTRAAEAAFESLTEEQRDVAPRVFLELVQPGVTGEVRRRRLPCDSLVQRTGASASQVATVLQRFEQAELIRRTKGFEPDDDRFEVAHETLVTNWTRLEGWLKVERQRSETKLQLITTARLWQESGRGNGYLLTGKALKDALPYREAAPELRELIAASERYGRRQRIFAALFVVIAAIVAVTYYLTVVNRNEVISNRDVLRQDYDERDRRIQELQDKVSITEASQQRLTEAEQIIVQQQRQLDQLRSRLGETSRPAPAPRPTSVANDISQSGQRGWVWIGSDQEPNLRDASTSDPVLPAAITPDRRYVMTKNVVLRSDKPGDGYAQSQGLGLVLSGTPVTSAGSAVAYDRPSGTKQYWLPVQVDPSDKPIVYYQYAAGARADAEQLANAVQGKGYRIAEIQQFDIAKGTNEVRYFYPPDKAAATRLAAAVTEMLGARGLKLPPTKVVDPIAPPLSRNYPGVLELWLDASPR